MIKLKLKELHGKDTVEVDLCNGGFRIDNNRYGHETIECDLTIQEIYRLYKDIGGLKAFKPYQEANPLETLVIPKIAETTELKGWKQEQLNAINYAINTWLENDTQITDKDGNVLTEAIIDKKPNSKNFIDRLKEITELSNFSA